MKETPQNFLIRTLDLRQKILFALQESESGLQYDPGLVQRMFLHTVLTGLQNDNIKRDLQPYLEQADISDELLLERMNTSCAYETERLMKKKMNLHHPLKNFLLKKLPGLKCPQIQHLFEMQKTLKKQR